MVLRNRITNLVVVTYIYNTSTGEAQMGLLASWSSLLVSPKLNERPCFRKESLMTPEE